MLCTTPFKVGLCEENLFRLCFILFLLAESQMLSCSTRKLIISSSVGSRFLSSLVESSGRERDALSLFREMIISFLRVSNKFFLTRKQIELASKSILISASPA